MKRSGGVRRTRSTGQTKPAPHPLDVLRRAAETHHVRRIIVGTSCGKDSQVCLSLCIDRFGVENVAPFFMFTVEGLSFQDSYLSYIERRHALPFPIIRIPHWCLSGLFRGHSFRHPTQQSAGVAKVTIRDAERYAQLKVVEQRGQKWSADSPDIEGRPWFATGEKAIDSVERNAQIRHCDGINADRRRVYPLAYWNHAAVFNYLKTKGIALPPDYAAGAVTSFGGLWNRELEPIRRNYPADYAKIVKMFPLVEAQRVRAEMMGASREP